MILKNGTHAETLSVKKDRILTVTFNKDDKRYLGLMKIVASPLDMGGFFWMEFTGADVLHAM